MSVDQGAREYPYSNLGGAIFLVTLAFLDISSKKRVYRDISHIISTQNKQQAGIKSICTEEKGGGGGGGGGGVMTATNMCSVVNGVVPPPPRAIGHLLC